MPLALCPRKLSLQGDDFLAKAIQPFSAIEQLAMGQALTFNSHNHNGLLDGSASSGDGHYRDNRFLVSRY